LGKDRYWMPDARCQTLFAEALAKADASATCDRLCAAALPRRWPYTDVFVRKKIIIRFIAMKRWDEIACIYFYFFEAKIMQRNKKHGCPS